jgi:chromosome segregation ATPase
VTLGRLRKVYEETTGNLTDIAAKKDGVVAHIQDILKGAAQDLDVIEDENPPVPTLLINSLLWTPLEYLSLRFNKNVRARGRFIKAIEDIEAYIASTLNSIDNNNDSFQNLKKFLERLPPNVEDERARRYINKSSKESGWLASLSDVYQRYTGANTEISDLIEACVAFVADLNRLEGVNEYAKEELGWLKENLKTYENELKDISNSAQPWEVNDSRFWGERARQAVETLQHTK